MRMLRKKFLIQHQLSMTPHRSLRSRTIIRKEKKTTAPLLMFRMRKVIRMREHFQRSRKQNRKLIKSRRKQSLYRNRIRSRLRKLQA